MSEILVGIIKEEGYEKVEETPFGLSGKGSVGGEVWLSRIDDVNHVSRVRAGCNMKPESCPVIQMMDRYCYARYPSDQDIFPIANKVGTTLTYCGAGAYNFLVKRLKSQARQMGSEVV